MFLNGQTHPVTRAHTREEKALQLVQQRQKKKKKNNVTYPPYSQCSDGLGLSEGFSQKVQDFQLSISGRFRRLICIRHGIYQHVYLTSQSKFVVMD